MTDRTANLPAGGPFAVSEASGILYHVTPTGIGRWNMATGQALATLPLSGTFTDLAVSPDGLYLLVASGATIGGSGGRVALMFRYDLQTMARTEVRCPLSDQEGGVANVAIADSGRVLFTTNHTGSGATPVRSFDIAATPPVFNVVPVDMSGEGSDLVRSADGGRVLIIEPNGDVSVYVAATGAVVEPMTFRSNGPAVDGAITADRVAVVYGGKVEILDAALNLVHAIPVSAYGDYAEAEFSGDGRWLYLFNGSTNLIEVWDTTDWRKVGSANPNLASSEFNIFHGGLDLTGNGELAVIMTSSGLRVIDLVARIAATFEGTNAADDITGTIGADTIHALDGADIVHGRSGDDVIDGGFGADQLYGEAGDDTFAFTSVLSTNQPLPAGLIDGGDGLDTLDLRSVSPVGVSQGDAGSFQLSVGSQTFTVSGVEIIRTGDGAQSIWVGNNYNSSIRIEAGGGADYVQGGAMDDVLIGGEGNDSLGGGNGSDLVYGGGGDDYVEGAAGDRLYGDDGNDTFWLSGAFGGAPLAGGVDGGAGRDLLRTNIAFSIDLTAGTATAGSSSFTLSGIEDVEMYVNAGYAASAVGNGDANVVTALLSSGAAGAANFDGRGGDDSLTGNAGGDALRGGADNDLVVGLAGDDQLNGDAGDDILLGGAGLDVLAGGDGFDVADYRAAAAGVTVNLLTGTASNDGDGGSDTLSGIEVVYGSAFNDSLTGDGGNNTFRGGAGVDVIAGGLGLDTVDYSGAAAGMRAQLNTNASTNDGDGGTDTFSGIENLTGSAFNDILIGDGIANVLRGGAGADTLLGLAGNDVLWGGSGALNTLQGGLGDDMYILEAADSITELAGEGTDTVDARINTYILANNVERLVFGGTGNFAGTGNALANVITGGTGNDALRGRGGVDVLNGGQGTDTADYTLAAAGVVARIDLQRATNDGDGATDAYTSIENLIGSNFNDTLIGDANANVLMGGIGTDVLLGFGGNDVLMGGSGGGNNQMQGGQGDDWYILDAFDTCFELAGEGTDTVEARVGSYTLGNNVENLLYTGPGKFVGAGNALNNVLTGGALDDILRGKGGNDTIRGGTGMDEVQFIGSKAQYTVTVEGSGYRIVDTVAARDGSTYVESIERLRFLSGNTTTVLTYAAPGALEPTDKTAGEDFGGPQVSSLIDDPEVLPGTANDAFVAIKDADLPLVLPTAFDDGLQRPDAAYRAAMWRLQMDGETNPLIVDGPNGLHLLHDRVSDFDAFPGFDGWS